MVYKKESCLQYLGILGKQKASPKARGVYTPG